MISPRSRKRLLRCIALGFVIEAPLLWWLVSALQGPLSLPSLLVTCFHMISLSLSGLILRPFVKQMSYSTANWIGYPIVGVLQAILVGCALFVFTIKSDRPPED
jgi:hypothetical protein